jgi:hypothetical protein
MRREAVWKLFQKAKARTTSQFDSRSVRTDGHSRAYDAGAAPISNSCVTLLGRLAFKHVLPEVLAYSRCKNTGRITFQNSSKCRSCSDNRQTARPAAFCNGPSRVVSFETQPMGGITYQDTYFRREPPPSTNHCTFTSLFTLFNGSCLAQRIFCCATPQVWPSVGTLPVRWKRRHTGFRQNSMRMNRRFQWKRKFETSLQEVAEAGVRTAPNDPLSPERKDRPPEAGGSIELRLWCYAVLRFPVPIEPTSWADPSERSTGRRSAWGVRPREAVAG